MNNVSERKETWNAKFAEMFPDFANQKYSYMRLEADGFEPLSLESLFDQ